MDEYKKKIYKIKLYNHDNKIIYIYKYLFILPILSKKLCIGTIKYNITTSLKKLKYTINKSKNVKY